MQSLYSFVVDGHPKFHAQAWVFLHTLLGCGVPPGAVLANVTPAVRPETIALLQAFGVGIAPLAPILRGKYCNKIGQFRNLLPLKAAVYVLCDTDLAFAGNPAPVVQTERICAKPVDLPNPRFELLRWYHRAARLSPPAKLVQTTCHRAHTAAANCNGGLYIVPGRLAAGVAAAWEQQAAQIYARRRLARASRFIDQIAFCLAMQVLGEEVAQLPVEYNFPIHLSRYFNRFPFGPPQVLHHHDSFAGGCRLAPTGHPVVDAGIIAVNRRLESAQRTGPRYRPLARADALAG